MLGSIKPQVEINYKLDLQLNKNKRINHWSSLSTLMEINKYSPRPRIVYFKHSY